MNANAEDELAVEIIASLINFRKMMVDRLLIPAGVPLETCRWLLAHRGQDGKLLSKREMGWLLMTTLRDDPDRTEILSSLFELAANWQNFDLAQDRFRAQASCVRAKQFLGYQVEALENEEQRSESARREAATKAVRARAETLAAECLVLKSALDDLTTWDDHQRRGLVLQGLLERLFRVHEIWVTDSFTRNDGGEQIDGAFHFDGWNYLVECRWRSRLPDIRQLDGLLGQLGRSGPQTMGLFLSIEGWSEHVIPLLKENPHKGIILMDGYDLRTSLDEALDLRDFILAKSRRLSLRAEPFLSVREYQAQAGRAS